VLARSVPIPVPIFLFCSGMFAVALAALEGYEGDPLARFPARPATSSPRGAIRCVSGSRFSRRQLLANAAMWAEWKRSGSQSLFANEQQQQPQPLPNAHHGKAA
jgi:hypothetical protein